MKIGDGMSRALRGPEPPFVGAVYQAKTKSGRRWEVMYSIGKLGDQSDTIWVLRPMGDDVRPAQNGEGKMMGGPRELHRGAKALRDPKKWRMVGTTARATA